GGRTESPGVCQLGTLLAPSAAVHSGQTSLALKRCARMPKRLDGGGTAYPEVEATSGDGLACKGSTRYRLAGRCVLSRKARFLPHPLHQDRSPPSARRAPCLRGEVLDGVPPAARYRCMPEGERHVAELDDTYPPADAGGRDAAG